MERNGFQSVSLGATSRAADAAGLGVGPGIRTVHSGDLWCGTKNPGLGTTSFSYHFSDLWRITFSFPVSLLPCLQKKDRNPNLAGVVLRIKYVIRAGQPAQCPMRSTHFLNELALEDKGSASHFFVPLWPPAQGGVPWEPLYSYMPCKNAAFGTRNAHLPLRKAVRGRGH